MNLIAVHGLGTRNSVGTAGYVQLVADRGGSRPRRRIRRPITTSGGYHFFLRTHITDATATYSDAIYDITASTIRPSAARLTIHLQQAVDMATHMAATLMSCITSPPTIAITKHRSATTFARHVMRHIQPNLAKLNLKQPLIDWEVIGMRLFGGK